MQFLNIDKVRETIKLQTGKKLSFKYNGARNQIEEFEGEIIETYSKIFVIQPSSSLTPLKSFSYSDILTESLEIIGK